MDPKETPAFCVYDQSNYQQAFWDDGKRDYEDRSEEIALKRMLPQSGKRMLEIGAGAGRNTLRYGGYEQIILMDYALTQMQQAQRRLGQSSRFVYVAADIYHLPFKNASFDGATMIRVLHHLSKIDPAMAEIQRVMQQDSTFILEFANKRNLKAILRYLFRMQQWNPFSLEQVEFVKLNFDNHPKTVNKELKDHGFAPQKTLSVSNLRIQSLKENKRNLGWMLKMESVLQYLFSAVPLSPSVFVKSVQKEQPLPAFTGEDIFICPKCGAEQLKSAQDKLICEACGKSYPIENGIYNFRLE